VRRVVAYASGAILASLAYMTWLIISARPGPSDTHGYLAVRVAFSLIFWLSGGFALALLPMIIPWIIVVWAYRRLQWSGGIYFPIAGSILLFIIACAATSIAPTPFWIDDQTLLKAALIAAQRQGISFLVSGLLFGISYWLLGEQHIPLPVKQGFHESGVAPDSGE
jgi:hypothetical protein